MTRKKKNGNEWLAALQAQGLQVRSARDGLQVKGWLDTGNYALNWAISGRLLRGYPLGHTVEIFGDPGTGKSFLISRAIAMAQAAGGVALLDDVEGGHNQEHMLALGVDTATLAHCRSRTVKQHLETTTAFVAACRKSDVELGVIAVDSLAQLSTDHEMETRLDRRDMSKAAELKALFRIVGGDLLDLPVVYLSANHTIAAIGNMFQQRTTPGGGGPKFMASVRLDLRALSKIKSGVGDVAGVICSVVVDKNRIVAPWKKVRLSIPLNGRSISRASGLVPLLLALGVLKEQGQFVLYDGERVGRTYKAKDRFLAQDETGERLIEARPDVLESTDALLASGQLNTDAAVTEPVDADDDA